MNARDGDIGRIWPEPSYSGTNEAPTFAADSIGTLWRGVTGHRTPAGLTMLTSASPGGSVRPIRRAGRPGRQDDLETSTVWTGQAKGTIL